MIPPKIENAFDTYKCYLALKMHFTNDKYDFIRYNGHISATLESYNARKDRAFFYRVFRKGDTLQFLVSNFVVSEKPPYIKDLCSKEADKIHADRLSRLQGISYHVKKQLSPLQGDLNDWLRVENGQHPYLLKQWLKKSLDTETILVLNRAVNFLPYWLKNITDKVVWPAKYKRLVKYAPFIMIPDETCETIVSNAVNTYTQNN